MSEGEERPSDPEEDLEDAAPPEEPASGSVPPPDEPTDELEPPEDDERDARRDSRRRRLEKLVPDLLKRAIERGIEAGLNSLGNAGKPKSADNKTSETIPPPPPRDPSRDATPKDPPAHREIASVPKEIAGYVFSQIDDTKSAMVRVVAREVREFLEAADLATELQKALTMLSFEIRTEIRFIPNEAGGIKPDVKAAISPKNASLKGAPKEKSRPAGRRPTALADEEDES